MICIGKTKCTREKGLLLLVYYHSENRATSQIWKILPNMVFPPILGGKWRRSEHAHASYPLLSPARVQPLYEAGRKESSGTGLDLLALVVRVSF